MPRSREEILADIADSEADEATLYLAFEAARETLLEGPGPYFMTEEMITIQAQIDAILAVKQEFLALSEE